MTELLTALPALATRWQPSRAGILNLWRYWDETFTFHRGRLLLRGPNGSGKSMALELLLPFLLDADASPGRLTSAAKTRGGLFERIMTGGGETSRAGFAWVEFLYGGDAFTVGVRAQGSVNTRKVDLAYFTTTQRVGTDLSLIDEHRVPLTRKALAERLGACGRVHGSGQEHRSAVREALFPGFGPDRYDSVITALLALRKEKLSQNLDLAKLSEVLSEALPPLDEHDLAAVAEGFERLDRRRAELAGLERELSEVKALDDRQRRYARVVLASAAGSVRAAETRRDQVTRDERAARDQLESAQGEVSALSAELAGHVNRLAAVNVEVEALKESDAYRSGAALDDLRNETRRLDGTAARSRRDVERAGEERGRASDAHATATHDCDLAAGHHQRAIDELREVARAAGAEGLAEEAVSIDDDAQGEALIHAWARARETLIAEMRQAVTGHDDALRRRTFSEDQLATDSAVLDARMLAERTAADELERAVDDYATAVTAWSRGCAVVGGDRVLGQLPRPPRDPAAVEAAVLRLAGDVIAEHRLERDGIARRRAGDEEERALLVAEREVLAEGRIVEPASPVWRTDRDGDRGMAARPGAPLWRLVDVAATDGRTIPSGAVDGLEAALVAAGLADAWVTPTGRLDLPDGTADLVVTALPAGGRTLADMVVGLDDAAVPLDVITAVLRSIELADTVDPDAPSGTGVVMATDGSFRLGAAVGRGAVRPAELLGAAAQERRRQARLAELAAAIAAVDSRLAEHGAALAALDAREVAARAELDAVPDGTRVRDSVAALAAARVRVAEARQRVEAARGVLREAEAAVRSALQALTRLASQHQLPTTAMGLDEVARAVRAVERAATTWARRASDLANAAARLAGADERRQQAEEAWAAAAERLQVDEGHATEVRGRLAALESTIGAEYRDTLQRIGDLHGERGTREKRRDALAAERPALDKRIGQLESALDEAERDRLRTDEIRAETHHRFTTILVDGFADDARVSTGGEPLDGVTAVLGTARQVAAELENLAADQAAVDRAQAKVLEQLHHAQGLLGGRIDLHFERSDGGWWLLRGAVAGVRRRISELTRTLTDELDEGRAELAADEERLFEQTLAGTVRQALAARIRLANGLVDAINQQLAAVRTKAGGVEVRLRWDVDDDQQDVIKAARALLLRDPADLSDAERADLQDFVRMRVNQARAELEENAPWEARLRETLDYRAWHRFSLLLGHRDWEGLQPATARRLSRLSTGERSIALHLPMLASIAAHYAQESGEPSICPRLILLDELFAGVDTANRAQLFGTFTAWDLDAVFTSDHEWCQYASLDGIAIHHLHPADGDEPVTSTRFTWDGSHRRIDPSAA